MGDCQTLVSWVFFYKKDPPLPNLPHTPWNTTSPPKKNSRKMLKHHFLEWILGCTLTLYIIIDTDKIWQYFFLYWFEWKDVHSFLIATSSTVQAMQEGWKCDQSKIWGRNIKSAGGKKKKGTERLMNKWGGMIVGWHASQAGHIYTYNNQHGPN